MESTRLGSLGLKISQIAMGTTSFAEVDSGRESWPIPYEDSRGRLRTLSSVAGNLTPM
jgi:aryl-alcohol dehydrogenase-like predicted oxidoreductase